MTRPLTIALLLIALAGCDLTDPYTRPGNWRPNGANDANLRAMVIVPSDVVLATQPDHADGGLAAAAVARLRHDNVRPLLDSGLAQIVPVGNGSTAAQQPAAAPVPGSGQ